MRKLILFNILMISCYSLYLSSKRTEPRALRRRKPKIVMFVLNDKKSMKHYRPNTVSLQNYATKFGYKFIEMDPSIRCNHIRSFFFQKHCLVFHYINDTGVTGDTWYFVLDGDNAVRNQYTTIALEDYIKPDKDILYYYRFHNNEIMGGNYAIKNSKWAMNYLKSYYELHKTYRGFNFDNGALHYHLLPDKQACNKYYKDSTLQIYDKFVGCVHKQLSIHNPWDKIYIYKHAKGWSYDGWVIDYKWSNDTLMHHAMKNPLTVNYKNQYVKDVKNLLHEAHVREKRKRPYTGWEFTIPKHCDSFPYMWDQSTRKKFIEIFQYLNNTFLSNGIDYTIAAGTVLGYKRHGDFIPWDDDFDVLIKQKDTIRAKLLVQKPFCTVPFWAGWKIYLCDSPKAGNYHWGYPFIDVFDGKSKDNDFAEDIMFPSKSSIFAENVVRIPYKLKEHLTRKYGNNYMTECSSPIYNHKKEIPVGNAKVYPCETIMRDCFNF